MNGFEDIWGNGQHYRIIVEPPNVSHPEGFMVAIFKGDGLKEVVSTPRISLPDESADELVRKARIEVYGHAAKAAKAAGEK